MKQPLYIRSAVAISPQHTFDRTQFLQPVVSNATGMLQAAEPDYRPFINPVAIRRMSRLMKMAISAAMSALKEADITVPDGIITGTGRGSMTDMEHFLNDMIRLDEGAMNPTSFIQSTYNSPNGWIALQSKSTGYNQTYVHRGSSMELAMLDVQLLFAEAGASVQHVLAGCYDEITSEYFAIKGKVDYWKLPAINNLDLFRHTHTAGTIGGEGAAFFTFSNDKGNSAAVIEDITVMQDATADDIDTATIAILQRAGLQHADIDLLLSGVNGDKNQQIFYESTLSRFPATTTIAGFKHLCGDYDTATGFAVWLSDWLIRQQTVPEILVIKKGATQPVRHILLINHYILGNASVMLISSTQ